MYYQPLVTLIRGKSPENILDDNHGYMYWMLQKKRRENFEEYHGCARNFSTLIYTVTLKKFYETLGLTISLNFRLLKFYIIWEVER